MRQRCHHAAATLHRDYFTYASVRNVFTVGVKGSIVPALFLEVELQSQELYERDLGEVSGLNVLSDVTYLFLSLWFFPAHPTRQFLTLPSCERREQTGLL